MDAETLTNDLRRHLADILAASTRCDIDGLMVAFAAIVHTAGRILEELDER